MAIDHIPADECCNCAEPEPALMDHGLSSLCEKCYRRIAPLSPKEPGIDTPKGEQHVK